MKKETTRINKPTPKFNDKNEAPFILTRTTLGVRRTNTTMKGNKK